MAVVVVDIDFFLSGTANIFIRRKYFVYIPRISRCGNGNLTVKQEARGVYKLLRGKQIKKYFGFQAMNEF